MEDLAKMYTACFNMTRWSDLKRQLVWSMMIFSFDHFHRVSELSTFCPDLSEVTEAEDYDSFGFPKYLYIVYKWWKGRGVEAANRGVQKGQEFVLHRNPYDNRFCAVNQLRATMGMLHSADPEFLDRPGPLFPQQDRDGSVRVAVSRGVPNGGLKSDKGPSW